MDKVAVISGASSGIGQEIAIELSKHGFKLLILGRNLERLEKTKSQLQSEAQCLTGDLSLDLSDAFKAQITGFLSSSSIEQAVLINNAGSVKRETFVKTEIKDWEHALNHNLYSALRLTQCFLPASKHIKSKQILNISSTLGIRPIEDTSAYSAAKAAMCNWTECLALELAPENIPVNCICPGLVETPIHPFFKTQDKAQRNELNGIQPLGRMGRVQDIAQSVRHFVEQKDLWITGVKLPVDGGILLKS